MKSLKLNLLLVVAFAISGFATADTFTIGGGKKGGAYHAYATDIAKHLNSISPDHRFDVGSYAGSEDLLNCASTGKCALVLAQLDAYPLWLGTAGDRAAGVQVAGRAFKECVFLVGNKKGEVTDEDHLQSAGSSIAVGEFGSGSAITWQMMTQLEPGYKQAAVVSKKPSAVIGALAAMPSSAPAQSLMYVSMCKANDRTTKTISQQSSLQWLNVNDGDLNDTHKDLGRPAYEWYSRKMPNGQKLKTISTDAAYFLHSDLPEDVLDMLQQAVLRFSDPE